MPVNSNSIWPVPVLYRTERQVTQDSPAEDLLGKLSGAAEIARPEFVADAGTEWRLENWNAKLRRTLHQLLRRWRL